MSKHPERAQDNLEHILTALERIQRYVNGKSEIDFMADRGNDGQARLEYRYR